MIAITVLLRQKLYTRIIPVMEDCFRTLLEGPLAALLAEIIRGVVRHRRCCKTIG